MAKVGNWWRQCSGSAWLALVICGALVLMAAAVVRGQSPSASLTVSATVVRSCSVSTTDQETKTAPAGAVKISCGGPSAAAPLRMTSTIVPVSGAVAGAAVKTTSQASGVLVNVDF